MTKPKIELVIPWDTQASKNRAIKRGRYGNIYKNPLHQAFQDGLIVLIQNQMRLKSIELRPTRKVRVKILLTRPTRKKKLDVVNLVDPVCDAAKVALGIDDQFFAVQADYKFGGEAATIGVTIWQ